MSPSAPRVLMTTDTVGGVLGYSLDLCRAITQAGGEVWLVTLGPRGGSELTSTLMELPRVKLIATDYKLEWMDDPFADVKRAGELLLRLERDFLPDVIHLNGYALGALPFSAPKLVVAHSCVLSWWQAVHGEPAPAKYDEYREQVTRGLCGARVVVAPSAAMLRALQVHYTPELRALVIPNAAPTLVEAERGQRDGVCTAGRLWDEAKNIPALLSAARGSAWQVSVAGPVLPPEHCSAGALAHDLPPNVGLLGMLSRGELARLFARSAVYVHPARYEPFGLAVLEAAQAGCALVLSDIPSLRELWDGAALFVRVDAMEETLRSALERLRTCPALRKELSRRARARASQYSFAAFERRYLALYRALAAGSALPSTLAPALSAPPSSPTFI